jgi:hypothetical protein
MAIWQWHCALDFEGSSFGHLHQIHNVWHFCASLNYRSKVCLEEALNARIENNIPFYHFPIGPLKFSQTYLILFAHFNCEFTQDNYETKKFTPPSPPNFISHNVFFLHTYTQAYSTCSLCAL